MLILHLWEWALTPIPIVLLYTSIVWVLLELLHDKFNIHLIHDSRQHGSGRHNSMTCRSMNDFLLWEAGSNFHSCHPTPASTIWATLGGDTSRPNLQTEIELSHIMLSLWRTTHCQPTSKVSCIYITAYGLKKLGVTEDDAHSWKRSTSDDSCI